MLNILVTVVIVLVTTSSSASGDVGSATVNVQLKQGLIEGVRVNISESRFFYSFRGIPYAKPPTGSLRFKDPVPAEGWSGLRKGMTPAVCPQISMESFYEEKQIMIGEEDCLYLYVHTPKAYGSDLPVMVFIHGGGFMLGDTEMFGGSPQLLLAKDIVLVSIQYRLGALGFLSTGDSVLPGNLGLRDQTLALKWVKNNIYAFGGDPEKVTIFGESAGGASVHYQMLTPYAEGLFQRAIMQSGTTLCEWALRNDHAEWAKKIAKDLSCPGSENKDIDSTEMLDCFLQANVHDLVFAELPYQKMNLPFLMVPRADGDYLPAHPAQLLREGRYNKVDFISGVTQHEAATLISIMLMLEERKKLFEEDYLTMGPILNMIDDEENSQYISQRILYHYADGPEVNENTAEALQSMLSDSFMATGHDEATFWHGRDTAYGKRVFRYELQHRPEFSFGDEYNTSVGENWVNHADDQVYLFDKLFGLSPLTQPDSLYLSDIMVTLWTNFAKTGDPTPDLELGFQWDSMMSPEDMRFLALTLSPHMAEDNRQKNREFWRSLPTTNNKLLYPSKFACRKERC